MRNEKEKRNQKYLTPIERLDRKNNIVKSVYEKPVILWGLCILFSFSDGFVLFQVMEAAITQNLFMQGFTSFIAALLLNFIPIMIAKYLREGMYKLGKWSIQIAIGLIIAFILIYSALLYQRFMFRDMFSEGGEGLINQVLIESVETIENEKAVDKKSFSTMIIFMLLPLLTSIINFVFSFAAHDVLRKMIEENRLRISELEEMRTVCEAQLAELEALDYEELDLEDRKNLEIEKMKIKNHCNYLRKRVRFILAEYLKEADAVSRLCSVDEENTV